MFPVSVKLALVLLVGPALVLGVEKFGEIRPNLKFVAAADGKSFFADSPLRTWENASIFCKSLGMELASITSRAQWVALDAAYDYTDFGSRLGAHWTSGQDRLTASQFVWQKPDSSLDESYIKFRRFQSKPLQCVAYHSMSGTNSSYMINEPCAYSQSVLCETNPN